MMSRSSFSAVSIASFCAALVLLTAASEAHAQSATPSTGQQINVFPPTNMAAGSGLLYFPAGGNSSLYAVPVLSDPTLISAINNQTTALNSSVSNTASSSTNAATSAITVQTNAIAAQTAVLQNIATNLQTLVTKLGATATTTTTDPEAYVPYPSSISCTFTASAPNSDGYGNYVTGFSGTSAGLVPFISLNKGVYTYILPANTTVTVKMAGTYISYVNQDVALTGTLTYDAHSGALLNSTVSATPSGITYGPWGGATSPSGGSTPAIAATLSAVTCPSSL